MTVVFRDGSAAFIPRARLIKLLGGELIRDEVMAVTELVKNAYDADASCVTLTFRGTSALEGEIVIQDDGCGMDSNVLLENWMQPAGSNKSRRSTHYTPSGRRMLGEKGVGRFAVDRLGRHVELLSRPRGSDKEIVATFDWDEFDDESRLLSDIKINWRETSAQQLSSHGTRIRITGLRMLWKERSFRRLCARLQRLLSPNAGNLTFRVEIESDEFPDYQGALRISFLEQAPYRIEAAFDGEETIVSITNGGQPKQHRWDGAGDLTCGPVKITIYSFDLETDALARIGPPQDVRAWLREWSGVSVYRDGFRVLPYGEPDDDWLRLDQRRVNNPVVCLSNNQVCGFVDITRDLNPELRDQTNRGGLLQNRAFEDVRRLALFALQIVEGERQRVRAPARQTHVSPSPNSEHLETDALLSELRGFFSKTKGPSASDLFSRFERNLLRERAAREGELESFTEMAAIGHGAGVASHALGPRLKTLRRLILSSYGNQAIPTATFLQSQAVLDELEETAKLLSRVAPSRRVQSRTVDLRAVLEEFERSVTYLLHDNNVAMSLHLAAGTLIRAEIPPSVLHQVLHILLWNSLDWIGKSDRRKIEIRVTKLGDATCRVVFQDTGAGIPPEARERIFDLGFSLKPNGRGMGLTVARRLLRGSGAEIVLLPTSAARPRTSFAIDLKLKRSRSTPSKPSR